LGDLGAQCGDLLGQAVFGVLKGGVVFGEEIGDLGAHASGELVYEVAGDDFDVSAECSILWAEWGCHLGGSAGELVNISTNRLHCVVVFGVLEVHGVVIVFFPSFVSRVVGVRLRVRVAVLLLVCSLCRGG